MTKGRYAKKRKLANTKKSSSASVKLDLEARILASKQRIYVSFVPALLLFLLGLDYLWVTEDAFITFKSVENFWAGYGPNFNRGIRVESFSHPLWFWILVGLRVCGADSLPLLTAMTGLCLSAGGLIFAAEACRLSSEKQQRLFSLGALTITALPPFWQFASSGLETGLTFFWIGFSLWGLVQLRDETNPLHKHIFGHIFWILGLAPLIRPDLLVLSIPLMMAACLLTQAHTWRFTRQIVGLLMYGAPATAWQLFRMGYYGALLPNTYIAKEGLHARWDQGFRYLQDTCGLYYLWPLIGVCLIATLTPYFSKKAPGVKSLRQIPAIYLIRTAVWCGALAHALLVCRAGGDFMHARLLLPDLFAIFASFAVIALPERRITRRAIFTVFAGWALYTTLYARPAYGARISSHGIADERLWYVHGSRSIRPISLRDYRYHRFYRIGESIAQMGLTSGVRAVYWAHIGIACAAIPPHITIIDPLGLNDQIGSRMELKKRGRPGHEKIAPAAWFLARYRPGIGLVINQQLGDAFKQKESPESIEWARKALNTAPLKELEDAVTAPMTMELFVKNVLRAWRLTFLTIPQDPQEALRRFQPHSDITQ